MNANLIKRIIILFIIIFQSLSIEADIPESRSVILEDFETYSNIHDFFNKWLLRDDKEKAVTIYNIEKAGDNRYLNANSKSDSVQVAKKIKWDIKTFPLLSWRWRAIKLPGNAKENARGRNDSGAAVYVIFQRSNIPFLSWKYQPINVIKYIWSTSLPIGAVVRKDKQKLGKTIYEGRFIVVESGEDNLGKWIAEERNVLNDYIKVFGKTPDDDPVLIAILSDSNDTKTASAADYDDLIIRKELKEK